MKSFKKYLTWKLALVKRILIISIILSAACQSVEAAVVTYYYSEHCETCKSFEPAWDEFVANEATNHITKKKSIMDADNLQELTQIAQAIKGRTTPSIPSIYIEFENKRPILLMSSKEVLSLYQAIDPGTSKTINYVSAVSTSPQSSMSLVIPVTVAAAADAVNPCAIFVFILAISYATVYSGKRKAILYGVTFAASLYLTYFTAGMAGKAIINKIFNNANTITLLMSGSLFIIAGFHLRTVLFPQKTNFSELSDSAKAKLIKQAEKCVSVGGAAVSGALCAMIELPCTGGPYAFALSLLAKQSLYKTALWLGYYNLIFISPILVLLCFLVISPEKVDLFEQIRNKYRQLLHLVMALCLTAAGSWGLWHYL